MAEWKSPKKLTFANKKLEEKYSNWGDNVYA